MHHHRKTEMSRRIRIVIVWLNLACIIAFALGVGYVYIEGDIGAPARVTDLDRAGVINEERLREWRPALAANMRRDLGRWIAEKERKAGSRLAAGGLAVALLNFMLLAFGSSRRRQEQCLREKPGRASESDARPAPGSCPT
jgi:uncharacterized membrane protein